MFCNRGTTLFFIFLNWWWWCVCLSRFLYQAHHKGWHDVCQHLSVLSAACKGGSEIEKWKGGQVSERFELLDCDHWCKVSVQKKGLSDTWVRNSQYCGVHRWSLAKSPIRLIAYGIRFEGITFSCHILLCCCFCFPDWHSRFPVPWIWKTSPWTARRAPCSLKAVSSSS